MIFYVSSLMVLDSELRRNEKNRKKDRGLFQMLKHMEVLLKQAMIVLGMFLLLLSKDCDNVYEQLYPSITGLFPW